MALDARIINMINSRLSLPFNLMMTGFLDFTSEVTLSGWVPHMNVYLHDDLGPVWRPVCMCVQGAFAWLRPLAAQVVEAGSTTWLEMDG